MWAQILKFIKLIELFFFVYIYGASAMNFFLNFYVKQGQK
jgi:hypothetical protein